MSRMTPIDDETLMRRVDGELSADAAAAVDAAASADTALAARLAALRALGSAAREAFPATTDRRDADLTRLIAGAGARRTRPGWRTALDGVFQPRHALAWGGVAAACFVVGMMVGQFGAGPPAGFAVGRNGEIADVGLVRVLDRGLAADGADRQGRAVDLTFRDDEGRWCRTFHAGKAGVAGLACREDGRWAMRALAAYAAPGGEIRTAASETPAAVLAAVDAAGGETLDAAAEARGRDGGWR